MLEGKKLFIKDIVDLAIDMQIEEEFKTFEEMNIFKRSIDITYEDCKEDIISFLQEEKQEALDLISKAKERNKEAYIYATFEEKVEAINALIASIELNLAEIKK